MRFDPSTGLEVRLILSPGDALKAARLGGMAIEHADLPILWQALQGDAALRAAIADAAGHVLMILLDEFAFEAVFDGPSPFTPEDTPPKRQLR